MWITACVDSAKESGGRPSEAPTAPLVAAPPADAETEWQLTTHAGGVASRYAPRFRGESLVRIEELRGRGTQAVQGAYAFQGARLMRYEGAPLDGAGSLLLEFDLQGKVVTARHDDAAATNEQISAIRTRAQLLRNHALAQQVSRTHGK